MSDVTDNIGQHDAKLSDFLSSLGETIADKVSHAFHPVIEQSVKLLKGGMRTPILRRPSDYGMEYEDCFFPSADGVPLEAWFIPANSDRLLIINHPMTCNRYGFPGHLSPWNVMFGGFEVNVLPELKHLHNAGYNILTYDLRNCGMSGEANGNTSGIGLLECRDVLGSVRYAQGRKDLAGMATALYGRCMGANSTIIAMGKWPDAFTHIKAVVLINALSERHSIERIAEILKMNVEKTAAQFDERMKEVTGFRLDELTPLPYAHGVRVPTLMAQLHRELFVNSERNGQEIFDAIAAPDKELLWIEESNQRFYAYNYFGQHPQKLIGWLDQRMGNPLPS
jgi:pimeloyl-ACP methyl ester carboxylesterase